jgi:hypothetical protein
LSFVAGCSRGPGVEAQRWGCDCTFLTDMDDSSAQKIEVCESTKERAEAAAVGCAQSGAPARVERCSCAAVAGGPACRAGDCTVAEHR